eukprot:1151768-Pelagomonas_calceolata.AAC.1
MSLRCATLVTLDVSKMRYPGGAELNRATSQCAGVSALTVAASPSLLLVNLEAFATRSCYCWSCCCVWTCWRGVTGATPALGGTVDAVGACAAGTVAAFYIGGGARIAAAGGENYSHQLQGSRKRQVPGPAQ